MNLPIIILLLAVVLFLSFRLRRFLESTDEIKTFLKEIASGNLNARLIPSINNEIAGIASDVLSIMEKTKSRLDFAEAEMQRMDAILRGMSDGVMITDIRGYVILANQSFKKLMSVKEDMEGKRVLEVIRHMPLIEMLHKTIEKKDIVSDEVMVSRDDKDIFIAATAVPVYSANSVAGTVLTLHDITRLRHLEEIRKDFVANVSHEIKTPITAVKGFAETLLDGALDDKENAMRFLGMIKNHSDRLNSLVDDLLAISRIELGDIVIEKTDVVLEQIVDYVFMTLKHKADKKNLYLRKNIQNSAMTIYADKDRLVQIILNLIDNGIKFTEDGGVTVGVEETGGTITLYIKDTGIGIPPQHLHRLGERFYRVDRARSRELGGTGLGLAIVKHLISAHDWNMRIESAYGAGTRVNIIIDRYL